MANPLQASLLRCAAAGISVFSPHTSLDSVRGGINDWLASGLGNGTVEVIEPKEENHGLGRVVTLEQPISPDILYGLVKRHLNLQHSECTSRLASVILICHVSSGWESDQAGDSLSGYMCWLRRVRS